MRTVADALAKLADVGWLNCDHATVRVCWMQLPDGAEVATVAVMARGEPAHRVILPAAVRFTAKSSVGERSEYDVDELDSAITDRAGNVQLRDGSHVHAVELIPVHLPEELTKKEEEVLRCVLDVLGLAKECCRPLHAELAPHLQVLDYALSDRAGAGGTSPSAEWQASTPAVVGCHRFATFRLARRFSPFPRM